VKRIRSLRPDSSGYEIALEKYWRCGFVCCSAAKRDPMILFSKNTTPSGAQGYRVK
jgi:hypothetical protein